MVNASLFYFVVIGFCIVIFLMTQFYRKTKLNQVDYVHIVRTLEMTVEYDLVSESDKMFNKQLIKKVKKDMLQQGYGYFKNNS